MRTRLFSRLTMVMLLLGGAVQAQTPGAVEQNFDDQLPGANPQNWRPAWGEIGDNDTFTISNMHSLSGKNSLVLDRQTVGGQYGVGRSFPDIKNGWCVISFGLLVEGAGNETSFSFEFRNAQGRSEDNTVRLGAKMQKLTLLSRGSKGAVLGTYKAGQWNQLTLWLPTMGGQQTEAYAVLKQKADDGTWKMVGDPKVVPTAPMEKMGTVLLNTMPDKRNFRVYVDDFKVEQRTNNHP